MHCKGMDFRFISLHCKVEFRSEVLLLFLVFSNEIPGQMSKEFNDYKTFESVICWND